MIQRWGAIAVTGGKPLLYADLYEMSVLENVYNAVRMYKGAKGEAINHLPDATLEIIAMLVREGVEV